MQNGENFEVPPRQRKNWTTIIVVVLVLFLGVWFLSPSGAIEGPVRMERGEDGQLHAVEGAEQVEGVSLNAHAGMVKSNNSRSSSSSSMFSGPGWFKANSLVILNQSDHLLMKRVGEMLLQELNQHPNWEDVLYLPDGFDIDQESTSSDIYMAIDLASIDQSGLLGRDLDAQITAKIGTSLISSHNSVSDHLSPPMVSFNAKVNLDHHSTMNGVESAGAKYKLQAQNIAKELVTALNDQITGLKEKHGPPPESVNQLIAEYRPTPDFDFLDAKSWKLLASTHGMMVHNDTAWTLTGPDDETKFVEELSEKFQDNGWQEYSKTTSEHTQYLRMKQDTKWFEAFPDQSPLHMPVTEMQDGQRKWYLRYRERMSAEDLRAFYGKLLNAEEPEIELLLALYRYADRDQTKQLIEMLETHPPKTVHGWMQLANHYAHKKESDKLISALQRATVFSLFIQDSSDIRRKIDDIIKKHKLDKEQVKAIDPAVLEEAGLIRLTPETPKVVKKFQAGNPVAFYIPGKSLAEWSYGATVVELAEQEKYRVSHFNGTQNGSRGSSSMCCVDLEHGNRHTFNMQGQKVRVEVKQDENNELEITMAIQMEDQNQLNEQVLTIPLTN